MEEIVNKHEVDTKDSLAMAELNKDRKDANIIRAGGAAEGRE